MKQQHSNPYICYPKSSPNVKAHPLHRYPRRQSRQMRPSRQYEFRIENPFKQKNEENYLATALHKELQNPDFISNKSIKRIEVTQQRRPSSFAKNLHLMQLFAKQQEQKYNGMMHEHQQRNNQNLPPLQFNDDDQLSLELNGSFVEEKQIFEDMDIFTLEPMEEEVIFYSNNELNLDSAPQKMEQEIDEYLN